MKTRLAVLTMLFVGMFVLFSADSVHSETAESSSLCHAFFNNNTQVSSINLVNVAGIPITYTLSLFDVSGTRVVPPQNGNLEVGASILFDASKEDNLARGTYQAVVDSSGEVISAVYVQDADTGAVGVYRGAPCNGDAVQYFGPFYMKADDEIRDSTLRLVGSASTGSTVQVEFLNINGTVAHTINDIPLPANGWVDLDSQQLTGVFSLNDGMGMVRVEASNGSFSGVLRLRRNVVNYIYENGIDGQATDRRDGAAVFLPFAPRRNDRGTRVFLFSRSGSEQTVNISYYKVDGSQAQSPTVANLSAKATFIHDLYPVRFIPGGASSIVAGGQAPLGAFSYTLPTGTTDDSSDSYTYQLSSGAISSTVPLMRSDVISPVLTVQNTSGTATNVQIDFVSSSGTTVKTITTFNLLGPGGAATFNVSDYADIPIDFAGSAISQATNAGSEIASWVHVYAQRTERKLYLPQALKQK